MKKIMKSFTFWFCIASILIIIWNITGNDDLNLLLIGANPILVFFDGTEPFKSAIRSMDSFTIWYVLHFCSFVIYGAIIDVIRNTIKKKNNIVKCAV